MRATFYLHNGAVVEADVTDLHRTDNKLTNELTGFEWKHGRRGNEADRLFFIRVAEVDAVVVHRDDLAVDDPDADPTAEGE